MELVCPNCGKNTPIPARVCQHCGYALTSRSRQSSGQTAPPQASGGGWGVPQQTQPVAPVSVQTPGAVTGSVITVGRKTILNAISGLIGSIVASALLWFILPWRSIVSADITTVSVTLGAVTGFCVPAAIASYPAIIQRQWKRALRLAVQAGGIGIITMTLIALAIARFVEIRDVFFDLGGRFIVGLIAWIFFGLTLGVVEGLAWRSSQRAVLSGIGGALGGMVAFFLGAAVHNEGMFAFVGLLVGFGSGLLQDILKQAWLRIVSGPNEGTEVILDKDRIRLGSSDAGDVDIGLYQDRAIAPRHMEIIRRNGEFRLNMIAGAQPPIINGQQAQASHLLHDGDRIQLGNTVLLFRARMNRS